MISYNWSWIVASIHLNKYFNLIVIILSLCQWSDVDNFKKIDFLLKLEWIAGYTIALFWSNSTHWWEVVAQWDVIRRLWVHVPKRVCGIVSYRRKWSIMTLSGVTWMRFPLKFDSSEVFVFILSQGGFFPSPPSPDFLIRDKLMNS